MRWNHLILKILFIGWIGGWLSAQGQTVQRSVFDLQLRPLNKGEWYTSITLDAVKVLEVYDATTNSMINLPDNLVYNEFNVNSFVAYGLSQRLLTYVNVPVRFLHQNDLTAHKTGRGIGDIQTGLEYALWNKSGKTVFIHLGTALPTGTHTPPSGDQLPLGDDVYQFFANIEGQLLSHTGKSLSYAFQYSYLGENSGNMNLGDKLSMTLIYGIPQNSSYGNFYWEIGASFQNQFNHSLNGNEIDDTGEFSARLLLGITYLYQKDILFRLGVPYTVYQRDAWFTRYDVFFNITKQF